MSVSCELILRWDATPEQQRAVGDALWAWCSRAAGEAGIYQYLDNQALADLLAGRLPAPGPGRHADLPSVSFEVRGDPARDREALLESLRRALPAGGTTDVRVGRLSWRREEGKGCPCQP